MLVIAIGHDPLEMHRPDHRGHMSIDVGMLRRAAGGAARPPPPVFFLGRHGRV